MIPQQLVDYIREQRRNGYSDEQIVGALYKTGYNQGQVEEAFSHVSTVKIKHEHHLSKNTVIVLMVVVGLLVISSFVMFFVFKLDINDTLLDVGLESIDTSVKPGDDVSFVVKIENLGSKNRYDVKIETELIDNKGKVVNKFSETKAVETKTTYTSSINLPLDSNPGNYRLNVDVNYDGKKADASLVVFVEEEITGTCFDRIKNQGEEGIDCGGPCSACSSCENGLLDSNEEGVDCGGVCKACKACPSSCDDNNQCTTDSCSASTDYLCVSEVIVGCCGNFECESGEDNNNCPSDCIKDDPFVGLTIWEKIDEINKIAGTNPSVAKDHCLGIDQTTFKDQCLLDVGETALDVGICSSISEQRYEDDCYSNVAKGKQDSSICSNIDKASRKDSCLMKFVVEFKDYSVCSEIANQYYKQSCESLRDLGG